jgi:hypothetical protein
MEGNRQVFEKFSGDFDRVQLVDLVQLVCLAHMSVDIDIESEEGAGRICIREGQIAHSELGGISGEDALKEVFLFQSGHFQFRPEAQEVPQLIKKSWEQLLIEAFRYRNDKGLPSLFGSERSFSGKISQIDLADILQLAYMTRADRVLRIDAAQQGWMIYFREDGVSHAECGELSGETAFNEIMMAENGEFQSLVPRGDEPITIEKPWENLLIDSMRYRDEKRGVDEEDSGSAQTLFQKLQRMKVAQKIRLAMTGDKETRTHLMRDSNRMVQLAVINNPRISEGEVTLMAGSKGVDDEILRKISVNREWVRLYQVRLALVTNPKCPLPISSKLIQTLGPPDWKRILASKSVPTTIAQMAKRLAKGE